MVPDPKYFFNCDDFLTVIRETDLEDRWGRGRGAEGCSSLQVADSACPSHRLPHRKSILPASLLPLSPASVKVSWSFVIHLFG